MTSVRDSSDAIDVDVVRTKKKTRTRTKKEEEEEEEEEEKSAATPASNFDPSAGHAPTGAQKYRKAAKKNNKMFPHPFFLILFIFFYCGLFF